MTEDKLSALNGAQQAAQGTGKRVNVYTCSAGHETITVDVAEGVTPFFISCRADDCRHYAASGFYTCSQYEKATHMFYRPSPEEVARLKLDDEWLEHWKKGGLILKPITGDPKQERWHKTP